MPFFNLIFLFLERYRYAPRYGKRCSCRCHDFFLLQIDMYITLMKLDGISRIFFQLSPSTSTITTENIVFTVWRSTYDCSCFRHRIAVTSCHLPVLYSGHPLDVMYFLILLLQRSSQLNLSKQYQPPRNNQRYLLICSNPEYC